MKLWLAFVIAGSALVPATAQAPVPIEKLIQQAKFSEAERLVQQKLTADPRDSHALTLLGDLRKAEGKYLPAEAAYRKAIAADEKAAGAWKALGDLYLEEDRGGEAIAIFERLAAEANSAPANSDLAIAYEKGSEFNKSLQTGEKIAAASRSNKLLLALTGDYLGLHRPEEAQRLADEILHRAVSKPELVPQLANVFLKNDMPVDAGEILKIFEHRQKPTEPYLTALANVEARTNRTTDAKQTIERALAMNPKSADALWTAARISGNQRNWKDAAEYLKQLRKVAPPRPEVLRSAVLAFLQVSDTQSAYEAALDWQDIQPNALDSMLALSSVYIRGMKMGEAQKVVDKALKQYPEEKRVLEVAGVVRYYLGNMEEAERYLTSSLGQGAADGEAQLMLGLIEKQRGNVEGAAKHLEMAAAADPSNVEALSELGPIYLQLNEPEKARNALESALRLNPNDAQTHYQLAQAYRKLGKNDEARAELDAFQKLRPRHEAAAAEQQKH